MTDRPRTDWAKNGFFGSSPDRVIDAYIRTSAGGNPPPLLGVSQRAAIAMFKTIAPDAALWPDDVVIAYLAEQPNITIDEDGIVWIEQEADR